MITAPADKNLICLAMPHRPRWRALAMSRIDPILPPSFYDRVRSDETTAIEYADQVWKLVDLDDTPGAVRHAVVIAADGDEAFMADASFELEQSVEGHRRQRLEIGLLGGEGLCHDPLCRGVQPDIGDAAEPSLQLRVQIIEIPEGACEEEVLADIAERALDLSLIWHDRVDASISLPHFGGRRYGETIRDVGHREHASAGRPSKDMGCEPEPLSGRPCGLPECAASADP